MAAAAAGYFVGQPSPTGDVIGGDVDEAAEVRSETAQLPSELLEPRLLSELSPSVATAVEAALGQMETDPFGALASLRELEDETEQAEATFELIGRLDATQLETLVTGLSKAEEGSLQAQLVGQIFSSPFVPIAMLDRWARLDPEAVIGFALSPVEKGGMDQMPILMRALSIAFIAQSDPDTAFEVADQLRLDPAVQRNAEGIEGGTMIDAVIGIGISVTDPVGSLRKMRERGVPVEAMAGIDPIFEFAGPHAPGVLAEIMQFPAGGGRATLLEQLYQAWGNYDLDTALASISALPQEEGKAGLLEIALRGAADRDPAEAARQMHVLNDGSGRSQVVEHIVEQWSKREPAEALRWGRENMAEAEFVTQLQQASVRLHPADGRALVEGLSDQARTKYFNETRFSDPNHYVMRMVREDPSAAMTWLGQHGGLDSLSGEVVGDIVSAGGIDSAIEFATTLPETPWVDDYLTSVARRAGRSGNTEWLTWARSQGDAAHGTAIAAWAVVDPQAAAEYAVSAGDGQLDRAVGTWAQEDPAAAFRWTVEAHAGDPESVASVMTEGGLLEHWGRDDPAAAADAMAGFPDDLAGTYIGRVVGAWAETEPGRASEYVAGNFPENGAVRDAVVVSLVEQIRGRSPAEAVAWAESISDAGKRAEVLDSLQQ